MFTSAINYLAGAASSVAGGTTAASAVGAVIGGAESGSIGQDDPLVGSVIEVGDVRVFIRRRIGEGGFAFVYHAEDMNDRTKTYALKRLLVSHQTLLRSFDKILVRHFFANSAIQFYLK